MYKDNFFLLIPFLLLTFYVNGQEETEIKSVQDYTPSVLINKGQSEFKLFNNLYTQTHFFDELSSKQKAVQRSTFFTSIVAYNYGVSSRVTLGGEIWFKSVFIGAKNTSPLNALTFSGSTNSRAGMALAGVKIKFNPVNNWRRFSVQSALLVSVISDPQSKELDRPFLDNERHLWITKFLYDKKITEKFQVFTQFSTWVSIDKNLSDENTSVAIPLDLFVSYFPTKKWTIYLQNQIFPTLGSEGISSYFVQEGLGVKYQLFKGVEVEVLYTKFLVGKNSGAGETFNLGVRILR